MDLSKISFIIKDMGYMLVTLKRKDYFEIAILKYHYCWRGPRKSLYAPLVGAKNKKGQHEMLIRMASRFVSGNTFLKCTTTQYVILV